MLQDKQKSTNWLYSVMGLRPTKHKKYAPNFSTSNASQNIKRHS